MLVSKRLLIEAGPESYKRGQAAVELTLGFLLFFSILMITVEFSHLLYTKVTLQHALRSAGRYMVTGQTSTDAQGNSVARADTIHNVFCANVIATGLQCPDLGPNFTFTCIGAPCSEPAGGPEQTVIARVTLFKPAMMPFFSQFFPSGGVRFDITSTWKNEPFKSS
ncbi:MAG TPA: TadE family protein [Candidatus Binatia bacterium]|jgi:hypothetical protein